MRNHQTSAANLLALLLPALALLPTPVSAQNPGAPDPEFGIAGRTTHDFHGGNDHVLGLLPLKDGRFLAAGEITGPNLSGPGTSTNFTVARFLVDGRLDPSFGQQGWRQIDIDGGVDSAAALTTLADGRIVVAGRLSRNAYGDFGVARLLSDGSLDTSFGRPEGHARSGWNVLDIGGAVIHDDGVAIAMQSTGRIIVAGTTRVPVGNFHYQRVAIARFTDDGLPDLSFGGNGTGFVILEPFFNAEGADYATGIALNQGGRLAGDDTITVVGYTYARNNAFIARLTANGQPDTGFGDPVGGGLRSGRTTFSASSSGGVHQGLSKIASARLLASGGIVVLGTGSDRGMSFMRLHGDGGLDTTFADNGRRTVKFSSGDRFDEPAALAVQGNGRLVAAGYATSTATGAPRKDFFVVRLNADGSVDNGFGDGQGRSIVQIVEGTDEAFAVAIEPSGRILAGGYALRPDTSQHDFALLRLHGDPDRLRFHDFELPRN